MREPHERLWRMAEWRGRTMAAAGAIALLALLSLSCANSGEDADGAGAPEAGGAPTTTGDPDVAEEPPATTPTTAATVEPVPPASIDECERQAQEARARLAYEPRRSMVEGRTYTVTAALGLDERAPDVTFTTSTTIIIVEDARCTVEAQLTGADFEIDPPDGQQQSFIDTRQLAWEWSVRPRRSGDDLALQLRLQSVVTDGDRAVSGKVVLNVSDIDVDAAPQSLPQRVSGWTSDFFDHPLVVVVGAPMATAGIVAVRRRWVERRSGHAIGATRAGT